MADESALVRLQHPADKPLDITEAHSSLIARGRRDSIYLESEALFTKGEAFFSGDGVPRDYAEAVIWFQKAANQNHVKAQVRLGLLYEMGWGVTPDEAEAVVWYRKAAEQGSGHAQFRLGWSYRNGIGTPTDVTEAIRWERMAAEQGFARAQLWLGRVYMQGVDVPRDPEEAYFWSYLARELHTVSKQGALAESAARRLDEAASVLTDVALLQTQDRAKRWLEHHNVNR